MQINHIFKGHAVKWAGEGNYALEKTTLTWQKIDETLTAVYELEMLGVEVSRIEDRDVAVEEKFIISFFCMCPAVRADVVQMFRYDTPVFVVKVYELGKLGHWDQTASLEFEDVNEATCAACDECHEGHVTFVSYVPRPFWI